MSDTAPALSVVKHHPMRIRQPGWTPLRTMQTYLNLAYIPHPRVLPDIGYRTVKSKDVREQERDAKIRKAHQKREKKKRFDRTNVCGSKHRKMQAKR